MNEQRYSFERIDSSLPEEGEKPRLVPTPLEITVVGSREKSGQENQEAYGQTIAERLASAINEAKAAGKKLVLDLATGSTPKAVWPAFKKMVQEGKVDLSSVIVMGHEEAWGNYPVEDLTNSSNFDGQRKNFLISNSLVVEEIRTVEDAQAEVIRGNFVPMHLVKTEEFLGEYPDESAIREAEERAAAASAKRYQEIIRSLRSRDDVTFFGLYGVGTDGHVAELQTSSMGTEASLERRDAYTDPIEIYSYEYGLYPWAKDQSAESKTGVTDRSNRFYSEPVYNNIFWGRALTQGEDRSTWQGFTGIDQMISLGWRDMFREEKMVLAFNNEAKKLAFQLALGGSLSGSLISETGETALEVERNKGEGESVLPDLEALCDTFLKRGLMSQAQKEALSSRAGARAEKQQTMVQEYFTSLYELLNRAEASPNNPSYADLYDQLWLLANRYVGKRAPVARLVKLRTLFGRKTELVAVPEVVMGTKYEALSK